MDTVDLPASNFPVKISADTKRFVPLKGALAGAVAGATEMMINFPTDYVKTQLQLDERSSKRRYNGVIDVIKQTIRSHGVLGLYRGLNVAIFNPKVAVRFAAFEQLKKLNVDVNGRLSPAALLLCGVGAGVCEAIFAITPIESIKVKFIHDQNFPPARYKGLFHGVREILKEHGIRGVYQGVVPTIIKSCSSQGIRFWIVETLKDRSRRNNPGKPFQRHMTAFFGAVGGATSVLINNPVDVVKSRMQGLEAYKYRSTLHCTRMIFTKEGPAAFYQGIVPRLIRVPIEVAIVFTVYDFVSEKFTMLEKLE